MVTEAGRLLFWRTALWEAFLDDQFLYSALEALTAARTDPALKPAVAALNKAAVAAVVAFADDINHPTASPQQIADILEMSFHYRGLVIERGIHADPKCRRELPDKWRELAEQSLDAKTLTN